MKAFYRQPEKKLSTKLWYSAIGHLAKKIVKKLAVCFFRRRALLDIITNLKDTVLPRLVHPHTIKLTSTNQEGAFYAILAEEWRTFREGVLEGK